MLLVLDAKTAFDTLKSDSLPQDRRTALDLLALKESLLDDTSNSFCRWVPGPQQLADGLTKEKGNKMLSEFFMTNEWSLKEDVMWQEQRAKQRENQRNYKAKWKAERAKRAALGEVPGESN